MQPQVLVTYDQFGGYGHPDHIQAHRVAMYAAQLAAVPSYRPRPGRAVGDRQDLLGRDVGEPDARRASARCARPATRRRFEGMDPDGPLPPFVTSDDNLAAADRRRRPTSSRRWTRCAAYPTQITLDGPFFALSNNEGSQMWGVEYFRIVKGERGALGADGLETDLFAGLEP